MLVRIAIKVFILVIVHFNSSIFVLLFLMVSISMLRFLPWTFIITNSFKSWTYTANLKSLLAVYNILLAIYFYWMLPLLTLGIFFHFFVSWVIFYSNLDMCVWCFRDFEFCYFPLLSVGFCSSQFIGLDLNSKQYLPCCVQLIKYPFRLFKFCFYQISWSFLHEFVSQWSAKYWADFICRYRCLPHSVAPFFI